MGSEMCIRDRSIRLSSPHLRGLSAIVRDHTGTLNGVKEARGSLPYAFPPTSFEGGSRPPAILAETGYKAPKSLKKRVGEQDLNNHPLACGPLRIGSEPASPPDFRESYDTRLPDSGSMFSARAADLIF